MIILNNYLNGYRDLLKTLKSQEDKKHEYYFKKPTGFTYDDVGYFYMLYSLRSKTFKIGTTYRWYDRMRTLVLYDPLIIMRVELWDGANPSPEFYESWLHDVLRPFKVKRKNDWYDLKIGHMLALWEYFLIVGEGFDYFTYDVDKKKYTPDLSAMDGILEKLRSGELKHAA